MIDNPYQPFLNDREQREIMAEYHRAQLFISRNEFLRHLEGYERGQRRARIRGALVAACVSVAGIGAMVALAWGLR